MLAKIRMVYRPVRDDSKAIGVFVAKIDPNGLTNNVKNVKLHANENIVHVRNSRNCPQRTKAPGGNAG